MSDEAVVAQKGPYAADVEEGETYYWCACGRSKNQPFCDGSHQGTSITPQAYTASETGTVYFCGCKQSKNPVLCDGSHNSL